MSWNWYRRFVGGTFILTTLMWWGCGSDPAGVDLTKAASLTLIPSQVTIDAIGGTEQLTATVRDALGNELTDLDVTFTSSDGAVVEVDAGGMVTARSPGDAEVTATVESLSRQSSVSVSQTPVRIDKVSGDDQSSPVTNGLPDPLVVQVNDRNDNPVAGVDVTFAMRAGPGTLSTAEATTGSDGRASTQLALGTVSGPVYEVLVALASGSGGQAVFAATGLPDVPEAGTATTGDAQRQPANSTLPVNLVVKVTDQYGNGVPGFTVAFSVSSGGGAVNPAGADTDEAGEAATSWTLGPVVGPQSVQADLGGLPGSPVIFTAEGTELAITSITDPLVEGQAAQITGAGFDAVPSDNTVLIDGVPAVISSASSTLLEIVVPRGNCKPEGPVNVVVSSVSGGTTPPSSSVFRPEPSVNLAVGERVIVQDPEAFCLQFLAEATDQEYLLGVQSTSGVGNGLTEVIVTAVTDGGGQPGSVGASVYANSASHGRRLPESARARRWRLHREAETQRRAAERAILEQLGPRVFASAAMAAAAGASSAVRIDSTIAVGATVSLRMPDLTANICTESVAVTATVKAVGARGIWLDDNSNPNNGFTDGDYQSLSAQLDAVVYDTDVEHFGEPTDLDGNGRLIVLVTEKLNDLSNNTLAFVAPTDLLDATTCPASNEAEIYYGRAPEPLGYTRDIAIVDAPELIAHEFTHVIQSGRRLVNLGVGQMDSFMAEGQATFAEEVVGHATIGNTTGQDYGFGIAFNQPMVQPVDWYEDGMVDVSYYFGRNDDDPDTQVSGAPTRCSWITGNGIPCQGRPLWYGVTWSLMRYISDLYGPHPAFPSEPEFHRGIIDNDVFGFENISDVLGVSSDSILANWAAALYVDNRVTGLPPELQITSWDFKDIFEDGGLPASAALTPAPLTFGDLSLQTRIRAASAAYYLISGAGRPATAIRTRAADDATLPSFMQIFLVRTR